MTIIIVRRLVGALALLGFTATAALAGISPPLPTLGEALRLKSSKVLIFQPVHLGR